MVVNFDKFLENKSTYHSINDLHNLARQIKDFTYNNDSNPTEYFKSIEETKDGFVIDFSFDGDKTYEITKKKVTNKGYDISIDEAYKNLDLLFNMIQTYSQSYNIQQIDEATEFKGLEKDLMDLVEKSAGDLSTDKFIKKWVYENHDPDREKTVTLEGFIQDEDKFDFYLKHRDDIDNLLKNIGFFKNNNYQNSLYGYLIEGTDEAVYYVMAQMSGKDYWEKIKNNEVKESRRLNEEIVWFRNFNKESNDFMDLLDAVLAGNKSGFSKAVNEFVLQTSKGETPSYHLFIPVINDKVYQEYYKIGQDTGMIAYNYVDFVKALKNKNSDIIFPKMLFRGVLHDMRDGGTELRPYTNGESREYLDGLSVERGKEKLSVILKNKGIIKEE